MSKDDIYCTLTRMQKIYAPVADLILKISWFFILKISYSENFLFWKNFSYSENFLFWKFLILKISYSENFLILKILIHNFLFLKIFILKISYSENFLFTNFFWKISYSENFFLKISYSENFRLFWLCWILQTTTIMAAWITFVRLWRICLHLFPLTEYPSISCPVLLRISFW